MSEFSPVSNRRPPEESPSVVVSSVQTAGERLKSVLASSFRLLVAYFYIPIISIVLSLVIVFYFTEQLPRIYRSEVRMVYQLDNDRIFGRNIDRVSFYQPGSSGWQLEQYWEGEEELLNSRSFCNEVVTRRGLVERLDNAYKESLEHFQLRGRIVDEFDDKDPIQVASVFLCHSVGILRKPKSRVVTIHADSTDPKLAAEMANGYVDTYVEIIREKESGGLKKVVTWFDSYVSKKSQELESSQEELHRFKRDNRILAISFEDRSNLTSQDIQVVNSRLNEVRIKLISERSLRSQVLDMRRASMDMRAISNLVETKVILDGVSHENELKQELAKLLVVYGDQYPGVEQVKQQITIVQQNIDDEINRLVRGIDDRVKILEKEQTQLLSVLKNLKDEAHELDQLGVEYNRIKDRSDNLRQLYNTVLKRSEELDINSMYETELVSVIDRARPEKKPFSPNYLTNLIFAGVLGLILGLGIIALIELLDGTIRSTMDLLQYTRRPVLGYLPRIKARVLRSLTNSDLIVAQAPKAAFSEGIKQLRTTLSFVSPDDSFNSILVTSPGPEEGKTLISVSMGVAFAQSGLRTVIIDCDLRKPRLHKAFKQNNTVGVNELVQRGQDIDETVRNTEVENLFIITAGEIPSNPNEVLLKPAFGELIATLTKKFDRVLIDTPPLGVMSDALVITRFVDASVLVVKIRKSRRDLLKRAIEQFEQTDLRFLGLVVNSVSDEPSYDKYYYYQYNYK